MDCTIQINVDFDAENKTISINSYEPNSNTVTEIGTFPYHGQGESILENVGEEIYSWISMWIDEYEEE